MLLALSTPYCGPIPIYSYPYTLQLTSRQTVPRKTIQDATLLFPEATLPSPDAHLSFGSSKMHPSMILASPPKSIHHRYSPALSQVLASTSRDQISRPSYSIGSTTHLASSSGTLALPSEKLVCRILTANLASRAQNQNIDARRPFNEVITGPSMIPQSGAH